MPAAPALFRLRALRSGLRPRPSPRPQTATNARTFSLKEPREPAPSMTATMKDMLTALEAVDTWTRRKAHGNDRTRRIDEYWASVREFDWEKKAKGQGCEAQLSVTVGVGELSAAEHSDAPPVLVVKFVDTTVKSHDNSSDPPPVIWAVAVTAKEVKELEKQIAAGATSTLIHREPDDDDFDEADEPYFSDAQWVLDDSAKKIKGMKLRVKVSQDSKPKEVTVHFRARGDRFEKGDVSKPAAARWAPDTGKYPLPAAVEEGDCHSIDKLAKVAKPAVKAPVVTGDSVLTVRAEGKTLVSNSGRASVPVAYQFLTTPKLVITNPTDSRISVTDFVMEYKDGKTEVWTKFVPEGDARPTVVGYPSYGGNVHKDENASSFEVDKHSSCEVHFTGRQALPGVVPYHGGDLRERVHHRFLECSHNTGTGLVECRVTLRDEAGKTMRVEFDAANGPLEVAHRSYNDGIAGKTCDEQGIGPNCECLLWLALDHPLDLSPYYVIVSREKTGAQKWYSRVCTEGERDIPFSCRYQFPSGLRRIGYQAKREKKSEVELEATPEASLFALVGDDGVVFGLRGEIHITDPATKKTLVRVSKSCKLDYDAVHEEEED
ncbi:hypothetical protein DIPPA_17896 [Diplonema papillatum]|nr:hypothetical protein DIPPA_17896 [Diplonema papillatum]